MKNMLSDIFMWLPWVAVNHFEGENNGLLASIDKIQRVLLSFCPTAFTEIAGILSAAVGTAPALRNALLYRVGIAL